MDRKAVQGWEIARYGHITKKSGVWLVPSRTKTGVKYQVTLKKNRESCTCPDFGTNGRRCKHIHAVIYKTEYPKTQLIDPPHLPPVEKETKTYGQDWSNYNRAQTQEKDLFMRLLAGLCDTITDEELKHAGRPRIPLPDAAFLTCYKQYEGLSSRRFASDVRAAMNAGFISCAPHFNSVTNALNDPRMTDVLLNFITLASLPLTNYEDVFAVDSSGFTGSKYDRWFDIKSAKDKEEHTWTKVHVMCGVESHIITAAVIKGKNASDSRQFPQLVEATTKNFDVKTVCADKAYASKKNYDFVAQRQITPYILFKSNHTGSGNGRSRKDEYKMGKKLWEKMFHLFQYHREEFLAFYHQRSNVETVFHMIKSKFGGQVRSKTEIAALNEVLCKIVCHNICCLISAMFELGLDLDHLMPARDFGAERQLTTGNMTFPTAGAA